jgi:DNA-binding NarL/FixJ family response regulator
MTIRVLLADDQALLRRGFAMIIDAQEDMEVVGEAADGGQAITRAEELAPDVVLMDVRMPGIGGIQATLEISSRYPAVKVLILTTFDVDEYAFEGLRAGASGFLLKNVRPDELLSGIRAVASGDAVLAPSTTRRLLDTFASTFHPASIGDAAPPDVLAPLTQRERQVFAELASGATNQEIAERFTLSETTVKTHVTRVLGKLNLRDRVQAVIFAYENGLSTPGG